MGSEPLTPGQKREKSWERKRRRVIRYLSQPKWATRSTNWIALRAGVSWLFADKIRAELEGTAPWPGGGDGTGWSGPQARRDGVGSELNDAAVRAKAGGDPAMAELLRLVQPLLVGMIKFAAVHKNDRSDAVQELLIVTVACVRKYDPDLGDFENYLTTAASNLLATFSGGERYRHGHEVLRDPPTEPAAPQLLRSGEYTEGLPPLQAAIVRDHFGIGLQRSFSINQIAARMGLSNSKVRTELREAIRRMRG